MAGIEDEVLDRFFEVLTGTDTLDASVIRDLRASLVAERLPTADALTTMFSSASGDALA